LAAILAGYSALIPFFLKQAEMIWGAWNRAMIGDLSDENVALFESALTHSADTGNGAALPYFSALHADVLAEQGKIFASPGASSLGDAISEG
jgi:hypothetical protein